MLYERVRYSVSHTSVLAYERDPDHPDPEEAKKASAPPAAYVAAVARAFGYSEAWLLNGVPPKLREWGGQNTYLAGAGDVLRELRNFVWRMAGDLGLPESERYIISIWDEQFMVEVFRAPGQPPLSGRAMNEVVRVVIEEHPHLRDRAAMLDQLQLEAEFDHEPQ